MTAAGEQAGDERRLLTEDEFRIVRRTFDKVRQGKLGTPALWYVLQCLLDGPLVDYLRERKSIEQALATVRLAGAVTSADVAARTGLSESTCGNALRDLARAGRVVKVEGGGGRKFVYALRAP